MWLAVLAVILLMLAVDLLGQRKAHVVTLREAAVWSGIWVATGLGFGLFVWNRFGAQAAGEYYAGYLIEKSLAVDNVFVFALIFTAFAVPRKYQHRVLFYGVLGALLMRAAFIAGGAALIERFAWVLYLFGAFLVLTGIQMFRHRNQHGDPANSPVLRLTRRLVPSRRRPRRSSRRGSSGASSSSAASSTTARSTRPSPSSRSARSIPAVSRSRTSRTPRNRASAASRSSRRPRARSSDAS